MSNVPICSWFMIRLIINFIYLYFLGKPLKKHDIISNPERQFNKFSLVQLPTLQPEHEPTLSTTIINGIVSWGEGGGEGVMNEGHGMVSGSSLSYISTWIMGISRDPVNVAWPISLWDLHSLAGPFLFGISSYESGILPILMAFMFLYSIRQGAGAWAKVGEIFPRQSI